MVVAELPLKIEGSLESLRQAATCPICTELYTRPKKLTNCSHVYCLRCLQQQMHLGNYPPCRICKEPITISRSEVFDLSPGEAEQAICLRNRRYESCKICGSKSNQNFVCDNCLPCHKTLKEFHNFVPIIPTRDSRSHHANMSVKGRPPHTPLLYS